MQVRPETKWKRDQSGKWTRVAVSPAAVAGPPAPTRGSVVQPAEMPGVTYRVRIGKPLVGLAARFKIAAVASGVSIGVYRGQDVKPLWLSTSAVVKGLSMTQSTVVASLGDGRLCEYDIASGKPRNTSPDIGGIPFGPPLATQDGWVVTLESGAIVATTGQLSPKWRFIPPSGTFGFQGAQSIGRGTYVVGESMVYRLDSASGLVNWSAELGERGCVTPTVTAGLAISAATGGGITCLDATTGKQRWRLGPEITGSVSWSGIASAGLHIIAATQQGDVICLNRETGRIQWVRTGIGRVMFSPIGDVKHGCAVVFVQDTDAGVTAEVLGLDLRSGRTKWRARVGNLDAAPVLTGDRLWIASSTGTLYAFDYG